jgi:hypothetical protein
MKIIRVFPRRTKATPTDVLAFVGLPGLFAPEADEIHISCTFTWDIPEAGRLAHCWQPYGKIILGGPAYNDPGGSFIPGRYLKPGYVITSRGCNNYCWFCSACKREGKLRELPITDGWNILDNNLLQCSESHIRSVFAMLKRQPHKAEFTGGLEARLLQNWHVDLLLDLRPKQIFFAYDSTDDREPLFAAGEKLQLAGFPIHPHSHVLRCYVLIGFPGDNLNWAVWRLQQTIKAGFTPMAMLWRAEQELNDLNWRRFQRQWARPALIHRTIREKCLVSTGRLTL